MPPLHRSSLAEDSLALLQRTRRCGDCRRTQPETWAADDLAFCARLEAVSARVAAVPTEGAVRGESAAATATLSDGSVDL